MGKHWCEARGGIGRCRLLCEILGDSADRVRLGLESGGFADVYLFRNGGLRALGVLKLGDLIHVACVFSGGRYVFIIDLCQSLFVYNIETRL